jgi:hypothetical protein
MAQLPYLPEEVLQNIMWQLKLSLGFDYQVREENCVSRKTLVSCLLSSRAFYRLAKPVLYYTINVEEDLMVVMEHIIQHPGLTDLVCEIAVTQDQCRDGVEVSRENTEFRRPTYMPPATFALGHCTRLHTINLETVSQAPTVFAEAMLDNYIAAAKVQPGDTSVPLSSLRKLILERPKEDDGYLSDQRDHWLSCFLRLPKIESLTMCKLAPETEFIQMPSSSLKSLTITEMQDYLLYKLEDLLKACPVLECLDMTMWPDNDYGNDPDDEFDERQTWTDIGRTLSLHGSKLRKIRFNCRDRGDSRSRHAEENKLINLASLTHLEALTLPIEAILHGPEGKYVVPAAERYQAAPGYAEDQHDALGDEDVFRTLHSSGQGLNTPTTPLSQILPKSLKHLRIMDDWDLYADAIRLDLELRDLMLNREFSELRTIRVRREFPYSQHVRDLGWRVKRREQFWNVLLRY